MKKYKAMSLIGTIIILLASIAVIVAVTPVLTRKLQGINSFGGIKGRYEVYRDPDDDDNLYERYCSITKCEDPHKCDDQVNGCVFNPPENAENFTIYAVGAGGSGGSAGNAFLNGSEYMLKDGQGIDFVEGKIDDKLSADSGSASGSPSDSGKTIAVANLNPEAPTNEDYTLQKASVAQTFDLRYDANALYTGENTKDTSRDALNTTKYIKDTLETGTYSHTLPHQMYRKTKTLGTATQDVVTAEMKPWFSFSDIYDNKYNNNFKRAIAVACGGAGSDGKPMSKTEVPDGCTISNTGTCAATGNSGCDLTGKPSCDCSAFMTYDSNSCSAGYIVNTICDESLKSDGTCPSKMHTEESCYDIKIQCDRDNSKEYTVTTLGGNGGAGGACVYASVDTTAFLGLSVKNGFGSGSASSTSSDEEYYAYRYYDFKSNITYFDYYTSDGQHIGQAKVVGYSTKVPTSANPAPGKTISGERCMSYDIETTSSCAASGTAGATRTAEAYQADYSTETIDSIMNLFHYYFIKLTNIIKNPKNIHQATSTGGAGGAGACQADDICYACGPGKQPCGSTSCSNPQAASGAGGEALYDKYDIHKYTGKAEGGSFSLNGVTYSAEDGALYNYKYKWVMPQASTFLSYGEAGEEGKFFQTSKTKITGPVTVFAGMPGKWDNQEGNFNASGKDGVDGGDTTVKGLKNSIDITVKGGAGGKGGLITNRYNLCIAGVDKDTDEGCGARNTNEIEATKERKSDFANISQYVGNSELTKEGNVSGTGGHGAGTQSINNMICGNTYAYNASASSNLKGDKLIVANVTPKGCENKLKSEYIAGYMFANAKSLKGKTGAVIITW